MWTDAELQWYQDGCMIAQPRVEPNHPEITVATAMAYPPEANPEWTIPNEES